MPKLLLGLKQRNLILERTRS